MKQDCLVYLSSPDAFNIINHDHKHMSTARLIVALIHSILSSFIPVIICAIFLLFFIGCTTRNPISLATSPDDGFQANHDRQDNAIANLYSSTPTCHAPDNPIEQSKCRSAQSKLREAIHISLSALQIIHLSAFPTWEYKHAIREMSLSYSWIPS